MVNTQSLKLQLVQEIINLPDEQLLKIFDSVKSLLTSNGHTSETDSYPEGHDPILDMIGMVSHGSLSANIDEELYGMGFNKVP